MWPTASAMGSIIAAVAVLLIHMETSAVAAITPKSRRLGLVPIRTMIASAMRRCSDHFSMAFPMKKPPIKRYMAWLAYGAAAIAMVATPNSGKSASGSMAVTGMGTASVSHHNAIRVATPATAHPSPESPVGPGNSRIKTNRASPATSPNRWVGVETVPSPSDAAGPVIRSRVSSLSRTSVPSGRSWFTRRILRA